MKTHCPNASRTLKQAAGFARALVFACTALACASAWAAPGNTAWTSIYNIGGEPESVPPGPRGGWESPTVMAVSGNIAYAAISGPYNGEPSSHADIHLRAFDIPTGALLWENVWSAVGLNNSVTDIAASSGRVFVVSARGLTGDIETYEWAVRAFAGDSGTVLWEDHCPAGSADRVLATPTWVYVAGRCSTGDTQSVRVRAYAAATGKLRWETQIPALNSVYAITLSGNKLLVTGRMVGSTGESLLVRAYGVTRGNLLWQRTALTLQGPFARVSSALLTANSGAAYLAWSEDNGDGTGTSAVVAYDSSTGRLRWQSYVNDPITALTLAKGWLYVAKAGGESMVSAYNASSGLLLWQDHPGTPAAPFAASALAVGGNQLFVGGNAFHPLHESFNNYLIRAYTLSGKLLWADDVPTPASGGVANIENIGWSDGITVSSGTGFPADPVGGYSLVWQVQGNLAPPRNHASFSPP